MADIICIIGNKGGTGKTTLSHMLSHGMALLGHRSVCVLTDTCREPLDPEGRNYLIADARTHEALIGVSSKIRSLRAWMGVIDGGGNRTEMDRRLYAMADLVLLPFRDSAEDFRTLVRDLAMFPQAYAVPSQWPILPWQREAADRAMHANLQGYLDRILAPIPALSYTKHLLAKRLDAPLPAPLNQACQSVARQVLDLLQPPVAMQLPALPKTKIARPIARVAA